MCICIYVLTYAYTCTFLVFLALFSWSSEFFGSESSRAWEDLPTGAQNAKAWWDLRVHTRVAAWSLTGYFIVGTEAPTLRLPGEDSLANRSIAVPEGLLEIQMGRNPVSGVLDVACAT